jgi:hypothetical protein
VAWGFHNATTFKQKATKQAAEQLIYGAGAWPWVSSQQADAICWAIFQQTAAMACA